METKICKQCGVLKPIDQYRKYYGGRKGHYNTCKVCEKVNARAKYLRRKDADAERVEGLSEAEAQELEKIYKLYELQRAAGLQPPNSAQGRSNPIADSLDDMLSMYTQAPSAACASDVAIPADIQRWLVEPLTEEPDFYLDEVYEELKSQYRPALRIGPDMQPVYDDTYKDALDQLLSRFYEYEESYWDKED